MSSGLRVPACLAETLFAFGAAALVAATLGVGFLNSTNWPTGGDTASHVLYAWLYANGLLFSGKVLPWIPEVFGGLPFLSYYFPLPFVVISLLSVPIEFGPAFKWGAFLAQMLLPGAVFIASRRLLVFSWPAALFAAMGALAFLLHEQHSIWGGNLLSTLAGEFAYGYGIGFSVLTMIAWLRAVQRGRGWVIPALLEAATGFSHGFPLLVVGFSTLFLLVEGSDFKRTLGLLVKGHALAFCLLGAWLWPMLEMHRLTIPNDAAFPVHSWRDLLPAALWPVFASGLVGLALQWVPAVRRRRRALHAAALRYLSGGAALAALGFLAGDQLGLADIRFFPMVWLFGAILCGWLFGEALAALGGTGQPVLVWAQALLAIGAALGLLGWIGGQVRAAPDWALWNHAGLDSKPQWHNLSRLFPAMRGDLWSPRLVFEHDPANNDIGSTRALEALPLFLNHRPVLEGLYMESALLAPAVYQLQSEISARPSSPLVRFPSGNLDPEFAARHMNFLHADMVLLRSKEAKTRVEASRLFRKVAEAPPFALYRLQGFDSRLAQIVHQPLLMRSSRDWMQESFAWFRTRSRFDTYLPVFSDSPLGNVAAPPRSNEVREKMLSRHEVVFETEAVGAAHLVKMAYHPRWQLRTKGSLAVAGPGFLLVVPQEREIRLVYGHTLLGELGVWATVLAAAFILFTLWRRVRQRAGMPESVSGEPLVFRRRLALSVWLAMAGVGLILAGQSPETAYNRGWDAMRANRYAAASEDFRRAYESRRPPAKKEEALFWLAKASELAGRRTEARAHYRELIERYHGYWVPESLYTYILLETTDGNQEQAAPYAARLRAEYPGNKWALKLDEKP